MLFSKSIPLGFLLFCLFNQSALGASSLNHFCFSHENYTANSPYDAYLTRLLILLQTKVPPTGFGLASTGQGEKKANGLALCRGDVSSKDCTTCVVDASKDIREFCPNSQGAIIWYDHCLFKYSNVDFFGQIDNKNKFYMWNVQEVQNPTLFNKRVKELLSGLAVKASEAAANPKFYAPGEMQLDTFTTLYGLATCTRDLSGPDCKKCLDEAISELPNCCDAKRGGRVVGGSCHVGFELYPIVGT